MEVGVISKDQDEVQSRQIKRELQTPASRRLVVRSLLMPSVREFDFQPRDPAEAVRQAVACFAAIKYLYHKSSNSYAGKADTAHCALGAPPVSASYHTLREVAVARGQPRGVGADPAALQPIARKREATDDAVASPRGDVDLSDQKRLRSQGNPAGGTPQTPMRFQSGGYLSTLPDVVYAHGTDVSLEYAPHDSGDSPAGRATRETGIVLPQSPRPMSGAVA
ncbi:unnamed protein product [Phytophthora fragariaefolia]|uniref:Unnamed protein product n=1 Tax=Phytophthora fragariaefolia TaxID=1490495 RepID=A0A9W6TUV4_9STRA|nr:unnamed protein product [Phytophthora fragariaefolia]